MLKMTRRLSMMVSMAGIISLVMSHDGFAQAASSAPAFTVDSLYAEARKEGRIVLYAANADPTTNRMIAAFKKKYPGIEVDFTRLNSGRLSQRYSAEKEAKAPTADVISNTAIAFQLDAFNKGWLTPLTNKIIPGFPGEFPAAEIHPQLGPLLARHLSLAAYNKKLVTADQAPKTWEEVVDPKWKGKVLWSDPREAEYMNMVMGGLIEHLGEGWVKKLRDLNLRYVPGGGVPTTELLAAGEASLFPMGNGGIVKAAIDSGAPLAYTVPNPQTGPVTLIGLNSTAAHPNAARLFIHFMLTEAASREMFSPAEGVVSPFTQKELGVKFLPIEPKYVTPEYRARINNLLGLK